VTEPIETDEVEARDDRIFPVRWWRMLLEGVLAAGIPWIWAVLNYRLWDLSPRVPLNSTDDARLITNLVKNTADQGWWTTNPDLGYPVGQQLYDFPHGGETWQLVILRFLSVFTKEPGLLMNIYFFTGIGVAALAAYLALRHLRFGVGPALVASTALTWLPFRLGHSQWHLFRTSFWWIPLAIVVVLWAIHWRERFLVDADPEPRDGWRATLTWTLRHNLRIKRVLLFGLMVLVLGMSETMTTAFTLTLLAITGLLGALRRREPVTLLVHGLVIAAIALVFFVGMASTLRFIAANGTNTEAGRREVVEQEHYGLKMSDMLLPDPSHRGTLGDWSREVRDNSRVPSEGGQSIGLLGAAGFVGAVIHVLTHGWGARRRDLRPLHDRESLRDDVSLLAVAGFLMATISGGAIFLSLLGFSQVRVWNRMSLLIGFSSLIYALTWLEGGWTRLRGRMAVTPARDRRWIRAGIGTALTGVLLAFVLWDGSHVQFRPPGGKFGLDYEANDAKWVADADYAARIDEAMPDGSAIFQFPIIRFPEAPPPGQMQDYDHLRAWIHLPPGKLKWSYGAMKGRPDGDWQLKIREVIGEEGSLELLIGLGFDGIWVDTWGYDDYGLRVRLAFDEAIDDDPILSADQRIRFYDLTPLKEELAAEGKTQEILEAEALRQLGVEAGS
jgi:phosphoglycerol transferase